VVGATTVLHHAIGHNDSLRRWARQMLEREGGQAGFMLAAVALANKLARIVFAILRSAEVYDDRPVVA
jgi:transposase